MKNTLPLMLIASLFLFCACAAGPDRVADAYRQALDSGDTASLEAFSAYKTDFAWAIKNGLVAKNTESASVAASTNSGSAHVVLQGVAYRLHKSGNAWKIDCSTAGPFNQSTPEMTLLMALHLVKSGRFSELKRLAPPNVAVGEASEIAQEIWREFAVAVEPFCDCRPFAVAGDQAVLSYGDDGLRQIRMQRNNSLWYIVEIN